MAKSWIYVDTSAFLKLFIKESSSDKMRRLAREHRLLSSSVITVECRSALARRRRDGEITEPELDRVLGRMSEGLLAVELVRVTDEVLETAGDMVLKSPLRTMDALHIASAFIFQDGTSIETAFVTADKKQHDAAQSVGLAATLLG